MLMNSNAELDMPADHLRQVFKAYDRPDTEDVFDGFSVAQDYDFSNPPPIDRAILDILKKKLNDMPALPEVWYEVQSLLEDPNAAPSDLGRIVAKDPMLTAQLIRICNSSAYMASGGREITNITIAVARLGMDQASMFILGNLMPKMGKSGLSKPEVKRVWFHSLAISLICRTLGEPSRIIPLNEIALLGLLHDIGKMVILHSEGETALKKLRDAIESGVPVLKAESDILGYTRIDAGIMLALHWKLPKNICHLISFHHHPTSFAVNQWPVDLVPAMMLVHTAHIVLQKLGMEEQAQGGIWTYQRTHQEGIAHLLHDPLRLTFGSEHLYQKIEREVRHLKEVVS